MKQISGYLSAALVLVIAAACIAPGSAGTGYFWSNTGYLYSGQATLFEIQVDCGAQMVLNAPYGTDFDIYAMRNTGMGRPTERYVMSHYDTAEQSSNQVKYLNLAQGSWYVVVYAYSGFGQFQLDASSTCSSPVPPYDPCYGNPNCGGQSCAPAATDLKTGYLNAGESKTYTYQIMGDRNYIEWILTGPCGDEVIPMAIMSANEIGTMRSSYCGPDFSLYIYKDRCAGYGNCVATKADTSSGSNKYVGITYPTTGARYYAQVYAKKGSGSYSLYARSYKCQDDVIIPMSAPDSVGVLSTASDVTAPVSALMVE